MWFFKKHRKYPMDYSNEMICNDGNYLNLCRYYEGLMNEYNSIFKWCISEFTKWYRYI